jgi:tRNA pseudouridine-54 N-methylase
MTRRFIVISNTVDTSKPLSLNSLTGYGRLDVICRCISNSFFLSNNFRKDVILLIYFSMNNLILEIDGSTVRGINPDERAIAGVLKQVFKGLDYSGIKIYKGTITILLTKYQPVVLDQKCKILGDKLSKYQSYLLGDQVGYPSGHEELFKDLRKISLGSIEYLSSQTINILNFRLDQEENELLSSTQ